MDYVGLLHTNGKRIDVAKNLINPVQITDDILNSFGFMNKTKHVSSCPHFIPVMGDAFKDGSIALMVYKTYERGDDDIYDAAIIRFNDNENDDYVLINKDLKHVHKLQNLYYELASKELIYNPAQIK